MHPAASDYVRAHTGGRWPRVVEFGGRNINGGIRHLINSGEYLSIDLEPGVGVDLVADCAEWDGQGNWDLVLCCEVLEHTPNVAGILDSAGRALRSGGRLVVTAACDPRPAHSAADGGPLRPGEFYQNVERLDVGWGDCSPIWDRTVGDVRATVIKR